MSPAFPARLHSGGQGAKYSVKSCQAWPPRPALLSVSTAPPPSAGEKGAAKYHFKIIDYGHAALHGTRTKQRLPRIPFFEVVYRWALGKGDTWRLLHSMINALDGRTWHEAQAGQVCRTPCVMGDSDRGGS